jgi:UDP-3-O-[3-hydroxymyristoyl] N-acetylglucosamine deacetylase
MHKDFLDGYFDDFQHTLKKPFSCMGMGLHSGERIFMTVCPAPANSGYVFYRQDVPADEARVIGAWHSVSAAHLSTTITNSQGVTVAAVEHLLAALFACGIDNAEIHLSGGEVPIMDGSALPFVKLIQASCTKTQHAERVALVVNQQITVRDQEKEASFIPFPVPWIDLEIDLKDHSLGRQRIFTPINARSFISDLAEARTFGAEEHAGFLKKFDFAKGGSARNTVLISDSQILNKQGLRAPDEFVRHKYLDVLSDLALTGVHIVGQFKGRRTGRRLNHRLIKNLMSENDKWNLTTVREAKYNWVQRNDEMAMQA